MNQIKRYAIGRGEVTVPRGVSGRIAVGLLGLVLVLFAGLLTVVYSFGYTIPPGMMGVRKLGVGLPGGLFGLQEGYHEKALAPGLHWGVPLWGLAIVYPVPQTVQVLHLHRDKVHFPESTGPLVVQTTGGVKVTADISLLYRFYSAPERSEVDGEGHGGPADLLQMIGTEPSAWRNRIRRDAEDELNRALMALNPSEFYNPYRREEQLTIAKNNMNKRLSRFGVKIEHLLLRRYTYDDDEINQTIFRKNLQGQQKRLNDTLAELADVTAELEKVKADFDAQIRTKLVQGEANVQVMHAEADNYERKKRAEGDFLVASAKAEVDRLKREVLANSLGAEIYVARELAPILGALKGGVVKDIDPFNLEEWVTRLGVTEDQ